MKALLPEGWPRPSGYSNGIMAEGRIVFVAGQIGWTKDMVFEAEDFLGQLRQTLENTLAILGEAGAGPEHIARMTWYVTSRDEYLANLKGMGQIWRDLMGKNYPTMRVWKCPA
nr:RidA family protein [Kordiimonas gwangyangensis]